MLPVVVNTLKERPGETQLLSDFLQEAREELQADIKTSQGKRRKICGRMSSRRERLDLGRYFDLAQRIQKARMYALAALEKFQSTGEEHWLDVALLQFETGERFQKSRLHMRVNLDPVLCDRLMRAS
jgi:hypothetical protein